MTKSAMYFDMITSASPWSNASSANRLSNNTNRICRSENPKISSCVQTKLISFASTSARPARRRSERFHRRATTKAPRRRSLRCKTRASSVLRLSDSQLGRAWSRSQQLKDIEFKRVIFTKSSLTWQLRTFRTICDRLYFGPEVNNRLHFRKEPVIRVSIWPPSQIETWWWRTSSLTKLQWKKRVQP